MRIKNGMKFYLEQKAKKRKNMLKKTLEKRLEKK